MLFDAKAARALSQRTHSVADCLALMKRYVMQAAEAGEYEVAVGLSVPVPTPPGRAGNDAGFIVECLARHGHAAWSDAVLQATHAGYSVRPVWSHDGRGTQLEGTLLGWRWADPPRERASTVALMPALQARATADAQQVHQHWVQAQRTAIQAAAQRGLLRISIDDPAPASDAAWPKRRDILQRAGFSTELVAAERGATLVVSW